MLSQLGRKSSAVKISKTDDGQFEDWEIVLIVLGSLCLCCCIVGLIFICCKIAFIEALKKDLVRKEAEKKAENEKKDEPKVGGDGYEETCKDDEAYVKKHGEGVE